MKGRITPEKITSLKKNEVFVFGSNESGIHGAGAALDARRYFGAKIGMGFGGWSTPMGKTFAIPTKDWKMNVLPLNIISFYVDRFIQYTIIRPDYIFLVTAIGTGLSGYSCQDIAPLFKEAVKYDNIHLPQRFWDVLNKEK